MFSRSFMNSLRIVSFCLWASTLLATWNLLAASQTIVTSSGPTGSGPDYINRFEFFNKGLFWDEGSADCSVEFRSYSEIGLLGVIGGAQRIVISDCKRHYAGFVRNDEYVY